MPVVYFLQYFSFFFFSSLFSYFLFSSNLTSDRKASEMPMPQSLGKQHWTPLDIELMCYEVQSQNSPKYRPIN